MKACVITIIDYKNYGNRLQNYALNKAIQSLDIEVVNGLEVFSKTKWIEDKSKKGTNTILLKRFPIKAIKIYRRFRGKMAKSNKIYKEREQRLRKFTQNNMKTFPCLYVIDDEDLRNQIGDHNIDYYIVGSDQVWNPYYEGHDFEFLNFTVPEKKLSFSASFGVSDLPIDCKERYANYLNTFKNLSVREKSGKRIIEDLISKATQVTIDPTLLLKSCEWEKITNDSEIDNCKEDYIVSYFLGDVPDIIKQLASKSEMRMYCLNDTSQMQLFGVGVETFLYLIKNAKLVLTDSFHATVFSLVFNTDFYVFNRIQSGVSNTFTRISSLIETFELSDRICTESENDINLEAYISKKKWENINRILDIKREEGIQYLKSLLFG